MTREQVTKIQELVAEILESTWALDFEFRQEMNGEDTKQAQANLYAAQDGLNTYLESLL